jgi:hypothetical protein
VHFALFDGVEFREVEVGGDEIVQDAQLLLAEVILAIMASAWVGWPPLKVLSPAKGLVLSSRR